MQKNVLVAALLLLYSLGMGVYQGGFVFSHTVGYQQATESQYQAAITPTIVNHIAQSEATLSGVFHVPLHCAKDGSKYIGAALPYFNFGLQHTFKQLQQFTVGLLLNQRKADLLFPVHFFW